MNNTLPAKAAARSSAELAYAEVRSALDRAAAERRDLNDVEDREYREILEDLIVAAANDARTRGERVMQERMAEITKGLPIPPGMKLF